MNQKQEAALQAAIAYEEKVPPEERTIGWTWKDIRTEPATLKALFLAGAINIVFDSNSHTGYQVTDVGQALATPASGTGDEPAPDEPVTIPDDIFAPIIGHDDVKRLLQAVLRAPKPVHVLLAGPPALAKSIFLWDIEEVYGGQALWVVGSALSQAGLWDLIGERRPRVLLIDELDKLKGPDQAALLSVMEGGRLVRAKAGGRALDIEVEPKVIAAANRLTGLSPELLSRFARRDLQPYTPGQFMRVVEGVLVIREGLSEENAKKISAALNGATQDIRDAVRVARLIGELDVDEAVKLLGLRNGVGNQPALVPEG